MTKAVDIDDSGTPRKVFFIGIGGIGMSAIARYFLHYGYAVGGYDRVETPITQSLVSKGAQIFYVDDEALIPESFREMTVLSFIHPLFHVTITSASTMRVRGWYFTNVRKSLALSLRDQRLFVLQAHMERLLPVHYWHTCFDSLMSVLMPSSEVYLSIMIRT